MRNKVFLGVHSLKVRKGISFNPDVYKQLERFCFQHRMDRSKAVKELLTLMFKMLNITTIERIREFIAEHSGEISIDHF